MVGRLEVNRSELAEEGDEDARSAHEARVHLADAAVVLPADEEMLDEHADLERWPADGEDRGAANDLQHLCLVRCCLPPARG